MEHYEGGGEANLVNDETTEDPQIMEDVEVVRDLGYSHNKVMSCSFLIFTLDLIINLDHGAMPAALTTIQEDLKLNNTEMGSLGSMIFLGITISSAFGAIVFKKFGYQRVIWICMLVNGLFLYLFT